MNHRGQTSVTDGIVCLIVQICPDHGKVIRECDVVWKRLAAGIT